MQRYTWIQYVIVQLCALLFLAGCAGSRTPRVKGADTLFEEGMKALEKKRCVEAAEKFQRLVNNFPGSSRVPDSQYYLAESYFCSGDYINAVFEYQRLLDTYPSSQWLDEAQFKIGESYYRQLRRPELDQKDTYEALNYFRYFVEDNPDSPLVDTARQRIADCRDRLAKKDYLNAYLYQRQGFQKAAVLTYEELLRRYPDTRWYYHGLLRMGGIMSEQGEVEKAREYWAEVVRDCGEEEVRDEARKNLEELREVRGE